MMTPRPYRDLTDFKRLREILMEGRRANNGTFYIHPGDVVWWLFYPDQSAEFAQRIFFWEDGAETLGWCLLTPAEHCFDVFVHPRWCGTPQAEAMFDWAEAQLTASAKAAGGQTISTAWVFADDEWRTSFLAKRGFTLAHRDYYFTRALTETIAVPALPEGHCFRATTGEDEAEERARASYGAFESTWEWGQYMERRRGLMRSPFYTRDHDCVISAPEKRIASFCIFWLDTVNRVGHFEPVGTHPDFQRRGLGKALLLNSLRHLQTLGMTTATVCTGESNLPAARLYESVGFRNANWLGEYTKSI